MKRRELRKYMIQILFQIDLAKTEPSEAFHSLLDEEEVLANDLLFVQERVEGTQNHLSEIDALISKFLEGWTLTRLPYVDRAILRLAVYELLYTKDTSMKVILNEAVELAKVFGADESPKFINGVLGSLARKHGEVSNQPNT